MFVDRGYFEVGALLHPLFQVPDEVDCKGKLDVVEFVPVAGQSYIVLVQFLIH